MSDVVKVSLKSNSTNCVAYVEMCNDFHAFLHRLFMEYFPEEKFQNVNAWKIYWIDNDGDKIDIRSPFEKPYNMFISHAPKKHIYFEAINISPGQSEEVEASSTSKDSAGKAVHNAVCCDNCETMPIVGFRYKCIQCPDFDLCPKCEGEMVHSEHFMVRFPIPYSPHVQVHRHFVKKLKRGFFNPFTYQQGKEESRHHGKHGGNRNGRYSCKSNIFTNLYTAMHDLAEGTDGPPTNEPHNTTAGSVNSAHSNGTSNAEPSIQSNARGQTPEIVPFMEPEYLKAGVEILNNFSQMFAKMLDPLAVNVNDDIDLKEPAAKKATSVTQEESTATGADDNNTQTKSANIQQRPINSQDPVNIEVPQPQIPVPVQKSLTQEEDLDWTMLDKSQVERQKEGSNNNSEKPEKEAQSAAASSSLSSHELNFAKLTSDLRKHLEDENAHNYPSTSAPEEKKEQPVPVENRAQIVFHRDSHINDAIITMMSMGFSNEGAHLTQLLESVNGNISQALDLMKTNF